MEYWEDTPRVNLVNVRSYVNAIFAGKNCKISSDRTGLTRSAVFFFFLIVVLAVGNHQVFKGPDDLNGYGYFGVRLYWKRVGLQANMRVECGFLLDILILCHRYPFFFPLYSWRSCHVGASAWDGCQGELTRDSHCIQMSDVHVPTPLLGRRLASAVKRSSHQSPVGY